MIRKIRRRVKVARYVIYRETLVDVKEHIWTFIGAFTGIGTIGLLQSLVFDEKDNMLLIGSFGATSVLIYGVVNSPLAQPRNLIGGHILSALVGVSVQKVCPDISWLAASLAVAISIVVMQVTKTLHPPGGATALIAVIGSEKIKSMGYWFVLCPVTCGVLLLFSVAVIVNNLSATREYPADKRWYRVRKLPLFGRMQHIGDSRRS